jgi:hypothetical protein
METQLDFSGNLLNHCKIPVRAILFYFFNFVILLKWQSSVGRFSQFLQYSSYESKKNLKCTFICR